MVLNEKMQRINAPAALTGHGLTMIGPAIIEFGTDAQCREHLPPIARGDLRWCQGYSEPGAGSDLASLQMRAVEDGDDYIVNGSKIWTSGASDADWIFCLVRTDPNVSKHEGISFLILDMETPGVTVTPIELISGASEFCQTFFDSVRVPWRNLIGKSGEGWTVGKRLLQYERSSIGGRGRTQQKTRTINEWAKEYCGELDGRIADAAVRDRVIGQHIDDRAYQLTIRRSFEEPTSSQAPSFLSSMFKLYGTEQNIRRNDLMMSILACGELGWSGDGFTPAERGATRGWLRSKAAPPRSSATSSPNGCWVCPTDAQAQEREPLARPRRNFRGTNTAGKRQRPGAVVPWSTRWAGAEPSAGVREGAPLAKNKPKPRRRLWGTLRSATRRRRC